MSTVSDSILSSTKKALGIDENYTAFDVDILMHINSVFGTLNQIGLGPEEGFSISDATATWDAFIGSNKRLNPVKTYVYLRVRMLFDPPTPAYVSTSMQEQIKELEYRLSYLREETAWVSPTPDNVLDEESL